MAVTMRMPSPTKRMTGKVCTDLYSEFPLPVTLGISEKSEHEIVFHAWPTAWTQVCMSGFPEPNKAKPQDAMNKQGLKHLKHSEH